MKKRSLASILMGSLHDPLQIMAPYVNNIKSDLQRCLGSSGTKKIEERIVEALEYFLPMENLQFKRKAVFSEAKNKSWSKLPEIARRLSKMIFWSF